MVKFYSRLAKTKAELVICKISKYKILKLNHKEQNGWELQKIIIARSHCLTPVILANQEAEMGDKGSSVKCITQ
jgi:hypothetical protein